MADELSMRSQDLRWFSQRLYDIIGAVQGGGVDLGRAAWASGHDQLRSAALDFGEDWQAKRTSMIERLTSLQLTALRIASAFEQADRALAESAQAAAQTAPGLPMVGGRS